MHIRYIPYSSKYLRTCVAEQKEIHDFVWWYALPHQMTRGEQRKYFEQISWTYHYQTNAQCYRKLRKLNLKIRASYDAATLYVSKTDKKNC